MNKNPYKEHFVPGCFDTLVSVFFLLLPFTFREIHTKLAQKIQEKTIEVQT